MVRIQAVCALVCLVILAGAARAPAEDPYQVAWKAQLGTPEQDISYSVATDASGGVYITGQTYGGLAGSNAGGGDAFLAKYDADGSFLWTRQLGNKSSQASRDISADGLGNVYISGWTYGGLAGQPNYGGSSDAFLTKYDSSGNLLWSRQMGRPTDSPYSEDGVWGFGVSADGLGNVYITGKTKAVLDEARSPAWGVDGFVSKYDASGNPVWTRQWGYGPLEDTGYDVSADGLGNVYVTGRMHSGPTYSAICLIKYNESGDRLWTRETGAIGLNVGRGVSADGQGNVYICGSTEDDLGGSNAGGSDAFVAKYDASGSVLWTRQLGSSANDMSYGVSVDGGGNVYICGETFGSLAGPNAGSGDAFVAKYDASGLLLWIRQLGTANDDESWEIAAGWAGDVYISGCSSGALGGPNEGDYDAFVAKLEVPEPATLCLLSVGGLALMRRRAP